MPHTTTIKVRFSELDPYSHVNHAAYITYFEVARTEALESIDASLETVAAAGIQFVVVDLSARFRIPAVGGDVIEVDTWISEVGRASTRWNQRIRRGDEVLVTEDLKVGICDANGKPTRPPEWLMAKIAGEITEPPT